MKQQKHNWTFEENLICTREAIDRFVINRKLDYEDAISKLYVQLDFKIKKSSILMKLENIKYLFKKYNIENSLTLHPLENVSYDNELAFLKLLREYNIKSSLSEDKN